MARSTRGAGLIRELFIEDWDEIDRFIAAAWGPEHPLRDKGLFLWQHSGSVATSQSGIATAAIADDQIVGLRGLQHLSFQIYPDNNGLQVVEGCTAPFMHVLKRYRGVLGLKLYKHNLAVHPVNLFLGANKRTSLRLHQGTGYQIYDDLPRFGLRVGDNTPKRMVAAADQMIDPEFLADVWTRFSDCYEPFSILRTEAFFRWRYANAPFWQYRMLRSPEEDAVAIYRIEPVTHRGNNEGSALRILEFFCDPQTCTDIRLNEFLDGVISFASAKNCQYVDHFQTMRPLQQGLLNAGFTRIDHESASFPVLFNPLNFEKPPINYGWKLSSELLSQMKKQHFAHYVVKSDSDQDRPTPRG